MVNGEGMDEIFLQHQVVGRPHGTLVPPYICQYKHNSNQNGVFDGVTLLLKNPWTIYSV